MLNLGQARLHSSSWDWTKHKYNNPDTDSRKRTTCGSGRGLPATTGRNRHDQVICLFRYFALKDYRLQNLNFGLKKKQDFYSLGNLLDFTCL